MEKKNSTLERRQVTVCICDLVSSTKIANSLDPEDYQDFLTQFKTICTATVNDYGGYIARYVGDALLVYFGYPCPKESDVERAALASLAIIENLKRTSVEVKLAKFKPEVRIGIATGLAVIGEMDDSQQEKALAVGMVPILAARLQTIAKPNQITITNPTKEILGDLFKVEYLGEKEVKGITNKIPVWSIQESCKPSERFEALHSSNIGPLIGRASELQDIVDSLSKKSGFVVEIFGEPGIGKSRFLKKIITDTFPHWRYVRYYGSSVHNDSMFYPAVDDIVRRADIAPDEDIKLIVTKLGNVFDPEWDQSLIELFTSLISGASYSIGTGVSLPQHRDKLFDEILKFFERRARNGPLCLVCEDVHWMDSTSVEFISKVVERAPKIGLFVLLTYRSNDFSPPWTKHESLKKTHLGNLDVNETGELLDSIIGSKSTHQLRRYVYRRTQGVPLYIEHVAKILEESYVDPKTKVIAVPSIERLMVPHSLSDLLLGKISQLGEEKYLLQYASALDDRFSRELLFGVSGLSLEISIVYLDKLLEKGLIEKAEREGEFKFHHALIQDAAYQSILRKNRTELHSIIGRYIINNYPALVEMRPEFVARHFDIGGAANDAIPLYLKAGQRYQKLSAFREAFSLLNRGIELILSTESSLTTLQLELQFQLALGGAHTASLGYASLEAGEAYKRARELCEKMGNPPEAVPALAGITAYHAVKGELHDSLAIAHQILSSAEQTLDKTSLLFGYRQMGTSYCLLGKFKPALINLLNAIEVYDMGEHAKLAYVYALDYKTSALCYLAIVYAQTDKHRDAKTAIQEAIEHSELIGHVHSQAYALAFKTGLYVILRETDEMLVSAKKTIQISKENGFPMWLATGIIAEGYYKVCCNDEESALEQIEDGLKMYRRTGSEAFYPFLASMRIDALIHLKRTKEAAEYADEILNATDRTGEKWYADNIASKKRYALKISGS